MNNKPMPLSELPDYIKSARENGQSDVPVVDMGRIVDPRPTLFTMQMRSLAFAFAAAFMLVISFVGIYGMASTRDIRIVSGAGAETIANIVTGEGGKVFSVSREDDGTYKIKVLTFRKINTLLERIRENKEVESAVLED